jgi:O-antigen ligase
MATPMAFPKINIWQLASSAGVFLSFLLTLTVKSGYSYGAALLLLAAVCYLATKPRLPITHDDGIIVAALTSMFGVALLIYFVHDNEISTLDQASRCLLSVPIMFLLLKFPPRPVCLWSGLALGTIGAGLLAAWQVHWGGLLRADGFVTSAIPFGNIALTMGLLCVVGLFSTSMRRWEFRILLLAGCVGGFYCSIASGSRGGWLALPPVLLLFCIAFLNRTHIWKVLGGSLLAISLSVFVITPESTILSRVNEAALEVSHYVSGKDTQTSIGGRLEAWRAALLNIPDRPILGWSHEAYKTQLNSQVAAGLLDPYVVTLANSHNNFLEAWLFQGILGITALLFLFASTLWLFLRRIRSEQRGVRVFALAGSTLVVSFLAYGLTHVILGRNNGITFFTLSLVIFWACMRSAEARGHAA